jgi:hypothetical protein
MAAFASPFAAVPPLLRLWNRAVERGRSKDFDNCRSRFWRLVNSAKDPDAIVVGSLLHAAGYDLQGGPRAPKLALNWKPREVEDRFKVLADRSLSLDHIKDQHDCHQKNMHNQIIDAANLQFMSLRNNSEKGHRYDADGNRKKKSNKN